VSEGRGSRRRVGGGRNEEELLELEEELGSGGVNV